MTSTFANTAKTWQEQTPNRLIEKMRHVIRSARTERHWKNRRWMMDGFVREMIRLYLTIDTVTLTDEDRDSAVRFLNAIRLLKRDYELGGLNATEERLPVLLASYH